MPTAIVNAKIITETGIVEGHAVLWDDQVILGVVPMGELPRFAVTTEVDVHGQYVSPGFIDIHSDMIEQIIQPRPKCLMDFEMAIREGEKQLVNQGITTIYHSLSLYSEDNFGDKEIRKPRHVHRLARIISAMHEREHLIHHRFHARYEIDNVDSVGLVKDLMTGGYIHAFSVMDHTPGQGQFHNLEAYRGYVDAYRNKTLTQEEWDRMMHKHNTKAKVTLEQIGELIALANSCGIAVASHDDDSPAKVRLAKDLGVGISEFPISMEAARAAHDCGLITVAGAPNILIGGSHSGNLCAATAIREGLIDVLCSDYYPAALLHSVFLLHTKHGVPLHKAFNLVTINPARAVKIDHRVGSIGPGKAADLLVIDRMDGYPVITQVLIAGQWVSRLEYRV